MAVKFAQYDNNEVSGASDSFDNGVGGVILLEDYFNSIPPVQALTLPLITDADTLNAPSVSVGAVSLTLPLITDADSLYAMTVVRAGIPSQNLTLPALADPDSLYVPTITLAYTPPTPVAQLIELQYISDGAIYEPTVIPKQKITLPTRTSESVLYPPTVTNFKTIELPYIRNISVLSAPSVKYGNILLPTIASGQMFTPQIQPFKGLLLPTILSEVLYTPTIGVTSITLELPTIDEAEIYPLHSVTYRKRIYTGLSYIYE